MAVGYKFYYDYFKSLMGDKWNEKEIVEQATFMADKAKTIKTGDNVVHIDYLKGLLSMEELNEIELELKNIGLELSSYDKSWIPYNSLDELTGVVRQIISSQITHDILIGVAGSAVWDGLCKVWIFTYKRLKGKKITKRSASGHTSSKVASMSILLKLNPTTSIEYNLRGDLQDENEAVETFKKIVEHAKSIPTNERPRRPFVAEANFDSKSVQIIDEEKFFRDKVAQQEEKEKKAQKKKIAKRKRKKK